MRWKQHPLLPEQPLQQARQQLHHRRTHIRIPLARALHLVAHHDHLSLSLFRLLASCARAGAGRDLPCCLSPLLRKETNIHEK
jgi:hypothetical protein